MQTKSSSVSASNPTALVDSGVDADALALVGQVVADRYEVLELLGVGGMGCVYRARHIRIRKLVALKTLHAALLGSPEAIARFEREAIAAARIDHPNVVNATDFGHLPNGRYYLVLELVEGRNLRSELETQGHLPIQRALSIGRQIASALAAAHPLGIVHRDLKPENVMLVARSDNPDLVKVLDFGIAKFTTEEAAQPLTQLGTVCGTPQYMSPEQASGKPVDGRSDLYALGIILFEMLTGKLPFEAADALGFIMQHLNGTPAPLPLQIPEALRQLVQSLLEKNPAKRPASAAEVAKSLDRQATQSRLLGGAFAMDWAQRLHDWARTFMALFVPQLKRQRRVGKLTLSTTTWLLLLLVPLVCLVLLLRRGDSKVDAPRASTQPTATASRSASKLPALSDAEFAPELNRIEQLKVYQRSERDWMLLARGSAQLGRPEQSVMAYQALLSLRADLRKDNGLLTDLLENAEDPKAFRIVVNLSETVLGRHGIDLIWELWQRERFLPDRKERTDKLAKKLVILSLQASPALRVAIELTFTNSCEKLLSILARAATEADARSVVRLSDLAATSGCGPNQNEDCFPCLRESPLLGQARERAKRTPAPILGATAED
jgi:eukaryotic-like serine/threonine-protein kinase